MLFYSERSISLAENLHDQVRYDGWASALLEFLPRITIPRYECNVRNARQAGEVSQPRVGADELTDIVLLEIVQ
jgi:hypothetical protein